MNTTQPLVLVIEDDPELGELYTKLVRIEQGIAELSIDGVEALARLQRDPIPDLIVIDLHLPRANGEEILKQARANPRFAHTMMIVVTAHPDWAERMRELGIANAVLDKPVEFPVYATYIKLARERASQKQEQSV